MNKYEALGRALFDKFSIDELLAQKQKEVDKIGADYIKTLGKLETSLEELRNLEQLRGDCHE